MDGVGEWATTSAGVGSGNRLEIRKEIHFPHSLGMLYSAFTYYTGFKVNSAEYKLMGLAPYGTPKYAKLIFDRLLDLKPDGSFRLDLSYFDYCTGLRMTNEKFHDVFGGPPRQPDEPLTQHHMDLAASIQTVTEEVVLMLTRALAAETDRKSTRLNSSHLVISYAVFCLKKKKTNMNRRTRPSNSPDMTSKHWTAPPPRTIPATTRASP